MLEEDDNNKNIVLKPPPAHRKRPRSCMLFSFERTNEINEPIDADWINYISGYVVSRKYSHLQSVLDADTQQAQFEAVRQFTSAVRTLKTEHDDINKKNDMISEIVSMLASVIRSDLDYEDKIVICAVPTSTPDKANLHGATRIAQELARVTKNIDGTDDIYRIAPKKAFHLGGKRSSKDALQHLIIEKGAVHNRVVLLLDDVVKTGTNLNTIREVLLKKHGALRVVCLAVSCVFTNKAATYNFKSYFDTKLQEFIAQKDSRIFNIENLLKANDAMFSANQPMSLKHSGPVRPLIRIHGTAKKRLKLT